VGGIYTLGVSWFHIFRAFYYGHNFLFTLTLILGLLISTGLTFAEILVFNPFLRISFKRHFRSLFVLLIFYIFSFVAGVLFRIYLLGFDNFYDEWADVADFGFLIAEYASFFMLWFYGLYLGWLSIMLSNLAWILVIFSILFFSIAYLEYYYPLDIFAENTLSDSDRLWLFSRRSGCLYKILTVFCWPIFFLSIVLYGGFLLLFLYLVSFVGRLVEMVLLLYYYVVIFTPISFYLFLEKLYSLTFWFLYQLRYIYLKVKISWFWGGQTLIALFLHFLRLGRRIQWFKLMQWLCKVLFLRFFWGFFYISLSFSVGLFIGSFVYLKIFLSYLFSIIFKPISYRRFVSFRLYRLENALVTGFLRRKAKQCFFLVKVLLLGFLILYIIGVCFFFLL
jgi:hypothetical protein